MKRQYFLENNPKLRRDIRDKDVTEMYIVDKMSSNDIAKRLGCTYGLVMYRLKKNSIPIRSASEAHKLKPVRYWLGKKLPLEMIDKTIKTRRIRDAVDIGKKRNRKPSESYIGEKNQFYGKHHTMESRKVIKEERKKQIFPMRDSSIEVKIQNFLKQLGIDFFTHNYIEEIEHGYQCDILIPTMNLIIECDGDYWHNYPVGKQIDHIRTKELIEKGFKVLRMWECDINKLTIEQFSNKLTQQEVGLNEK